MEENDEKNYLFVGLLAINIGVYYIYAAKCEVTEFFKASVYTRSLVLVGFAIFALTGLAKPMLVAFGVVGFPGRSLDVACAEECRLSHTD